MGPDGKVRVLGFPADDFACGQWRIIQPVAAMRDARVEARLREGKTVEVDSFDVAQFQRLVWPAQLEPVRMLKRIGKRVVVDYDDAFPLTDGGHPEYELFAPGTPNAAALAEVLSLADVVTVPTPELVEHYRKVHARVVLLPNAVDLEGSLYAPGRLKRASEKLTVFWSGWTSHAANLRMVEPVITRILREREDVAFALCGPEEFLPIFDRAGETGRVIHMDCVPYGHFMRAASLADVAIAPLERTEFNDNKSEIRVIEAGAWGVPAVASAVAPYRRFEGGDAACLLVEGNDPDGWHSCITRLLDDPTLREVTGRRARIAVATRYSLSGVNWKRAELWNAVGRGIDEVTKGSGW
jgi:glycosyltransferase involved in cell wall biosynthesis